MLCTERFSRFSLLAQALHLALRLSLILYPVDSLVILIRCNVPSPEYMADPIYRSRHVRSGSPALTVQINGANSDVEVGTLSLM